MKKLFVSLSTITIALLCSFTVLASTAVSGETPKHEGTCNENITWSLYDSGELVINGSGDIPDYSSSDSAPWNSYRSSIESVTINQGITSIGEYAFYNLKELKEAVIAPGITTIKFASFSECKKLTTIEIPDSVKSIGSNAFNNCNNLAAMYYMGTEEAWNAVSIDALNDKLKNSTKIFVPKGNILIKYDANGGTGGPFGSSASPNSSNVLIPNTVPEKEAGLFSGWASAKDAATAEYQPGDSISVGEDNITLYAVWQIGGTCGTNLMWELKDNGTLEITGTGKMDDFQSDSMPWYDVRQNIISVTIEDGVTSIGTQAFRGCSNLASITISDSVTSIGNSAFYECVNLLSVKIPQGVTTIANHTFCDCACLASVDIPDSVTSIGNHAFNNCSSLTSIEIPCRVISIGNYAFYQCYYLSEINIPNSVTTIGDYAFYQCDRAKTIKISETATSIGSYAFSECYDVTNIKIPESVTSIGMGAFRNCRSLTGIKIPDGITTINNYTFYQCSSLTSIEIPDSVTTIGMCAFYKCNELKDILYHGTKQEWNDISIGNDNRPLSINIVEFRDRINIAKTDFGLKNGALVANLDFGWAKEDALAYVMIYDANSNMMVGIGLTTVKKGDTSAEIVVSTDTDCNGYQYKIMLWSPDTISPYIKPSEGELQL